MGYQQAPPAAGSSYQQQAPQTAGSSYQQQAPQIVGSSYQQQAPPVVASSYQQQAPPAVASSYQQQAAVDSTEQESKTEEVSPRSMTMTTILMLVGAVVLGGAGIYCMTQGKLGSDSAGLLYAGIALLGVGIVAAVIVFVFFSKRRCCGHE
jgi:uncharacterized membrane-anchored protein